MQPKVPIYIYIFLILMFFVQSICVAGTINKCTDSNGNVYFTDTQCPTASTVRKETIQTQSNQSNIVRSDRYSVQNQLRGIEARKAHDRKKREANQYNSTTKNGAVDGRPVLTYKQARERALVDAGYRKDSNFTHHNREKEVEKEMQKYNHLPMTYREAKNKALDKTGYRSNEGLTDHQRAIVGREMSNYEYLSRDGEYYGKRAAGNEHQRRLEDAEDEEDKIRDVQSAYRRETRLRDAGVQGRDIRYQRAAKDCKFTSKANCW